MNEMMTQEIAAQAGILSACLGPLAQAISTIAPAKGRILAGGCGDSAFAPAALAGVFATLGTEICACTSQELAAFTRFKPSDTVILSSISGGTRRTVEAARAARAASVRVIALTCKADSDLDKTADQTILFPFSPLSRKTPHTLDYSVTLLALALLPLVWSGHGESDIAPLFEQLPHLLDTARTNAFAIAEQMNIHGKIFLLGSGPELASAKYGAAKFHEAGGLFAMAAETENFIHGMNFMVEPKDNILALGGNAPGLHRGAEVTGAFQDFVAYASVIVPEDFADGGWRKALVDLLSTTFILQNLCLAVADKLGLAVEQPRAGRANGVAHLAIQSAIMSK